MAPALELHRDFEPDTDSINSSTPTKSGRISTFLSRLASTAKPAPPGTRKYSNRRVFRILNKVLQPESTVTAEDAAGALASLLPLAPPDGSDELSSIMEVFLEIAWQIPYNHPSMIKLVRTTLCVLDSNRSLRVSSELVSALHSTLS